MSDVAEEIRSLEKIRQDVEQCSVEGTLLLVDLVDSTPYKTRNSEAEWLSRLIDFQDAVKRAINPLAPTKFLGDGILGFYPIADVPPDQLVQTGKRILEEIRRVNQERPYRADHAMHVRVVLSQGRVFLFEGADPQGSAVDKLFRIEKYVPGDCIGMTEEYKSKVECPDCVLAGRYRLKGLAEGRHRLFLIGPVGEIATTKIEKARRRAALHDIWDLGSTGEGKIFLVTGYIPPEEGQPCMIQMGDKEAMITAYKNLALAGRLEEVEEMTSHDVRDYHLRENIVCIGGPYWNQVTGKFMREIKSPFVFDFSNQADDRTPLMDCLANKVYADAWSGVRLSRDCGFFARFKNPFNPDRHVILACGIETPAVKGLLLAFSEDQNDFLKLHDAILHGVVPGDTSTGELADFFALMEFRVEYNGSVHLPTAADQIKRIVFNWTSGHNSQLQEALTE